MKITDKKKTTLLLLAAAVILAAAFLLFFQKGAFLSDEINWREGDLSFEGGEVKVRNRNAMIYFEGRKVWQNAWNVNVQQCLVSDIDKDGQDELLMLVWKRGSYGSHMPFWVKHNDNNLAQHIFIYKWEPTRPSKLRAIWMSSAVSDRFNSLCASDNGEIFITDNFGNVKAWYWEGFGLKLLSDDCDFLDYIALGDQLLNLAVIREGIKTGDYSYMYEDIAKEVREADVASLNQETVYVEDKGLISDYPCFGSPIEVCDAVADMGIDVVSLANNHALDKGMYGINKSLEANSAHGINTLGVHTEEDASDPAEAVTYMTVNNIRLALLSFTYGINGNPEPKDQPYAVEVLKDRERLVKALDIARAKADCVIVYAHWGTEYSPEISEDQKQYCDLFLDHGVDVVIGTHPHVIQPMEYIHGQNHDMLVYYSLGNLISHQTKEECQKGAAATFKIFKLNDKKVVVADYDMIFMETRDKAVWIR